MDTASLDYTEKAARDWYDLRPDVEWDEDEREQFGVYVRCYAENIGSLDFHIPTVYRVEWSGR